MLLSFVFIGTTYLTNKYERLNVRETPLRWSSSKVMKNKVVVGFAIRNDLKALGLEACRWEIGDKAA